MAYPTLHEIRASADEYWNLWEALLGQAGELRRVVGQHYATGLGWKVDGDLAPIEAAMYLFELGDRLYAGPVNQERTILTIRKSNPVALDTLCEIELMQRRPSKPDDKLGLDKLDLLLPHGLPTVDKIQKALKGTEASCQFESNEVHEWISIKFEGCEFKLFDQPVWNICVKEAAAVVGLPVG